MADQDLAVSLARAELSPPTVGVTAQFFEVHEVVVDETGQPSVAHVDVERERGAYYVYFSVQEVPYYFVVIVESAARRQLAVSGRYVEAKVRVYLRISSPTLSPADITAHLGLEPTSTHAIGSPVNSRVPHRKYQENIWLLEPQAGVPGSVEQKLVAVLDSVEPAAERVTAMGPACGVEVHVVFESWGGDPQFDGIHVDVDIVRHLSARLYGREPQRFTSRRY